MINSTNVPFQNASNIDFIDMYYLNWQRVEDLDVRLDNPLRGVAIRSNFNRPIKVTIPLTGGDITDIKSIASWADQYYEFKIYYCRDWLYGVSTTCPSGWEELTTISEEHGGITPHLATAELTTNYFSCCKK